MVNIDFKNVILANNKKITTSISSSNVTVILGRNGTGKTTFLKTILGLVSTKSGQILVDNIELKQLSIFDLSNYFSYIPQKFIINMQLTVEQVVNLGGINTINPFANFFSRETNRSIQKTYLSTDEILNELGIKHLRQKIVTKLSGGEQAIVNIARALRQDSKYLLIDEGDANLDIKNQYEYWKVIDRLSKNYKKGIVVVSHDPNIVFNVNSSVKIIPFLLDTDKTIISYSINQLTSEFFTKIYGINMIVEEKENKRIVFVKNEN